jgi:hypothetical protein
MKEPGNWPAEPGFPLNPERPGWHWAISHKSLSGQPTPYYWSAGADPTFGGHKPASAASRYWYVEPCLTPADAAALRGAGRKAEEALEEIERSHIPSQPMSTMMDEVVWAQQHVGFLRGIARRALKNGSGS